MRGLAALAVFINHAFNHAHEHLSDLDDKPALFMMVSLAITIGLAWLSYQLMANPVRAAINGLFDRLRTGTGARQQLASMPPRQSTPSQPSSHL